MRLPRVAEPAVSVVMVTRNAREWTRRALAALLANTPPVYELVVVDNASDDGTHELLTRELAGATVLLNSNNVGFSAACNQGEAHAIARCALFLNHDCLVHPGWLPPLLEALDRDTDIGAVGPRLLNPDGSLQESGALISRGGSTLDYGDGDDPGRPEYCFPRAVDYVAGACLLVRRSAFASVGGFDAVYGLGYFEDVDLCLSLARVGLRTLVEPRSVVTHVRGAAGGGPALAELALRNRAHFEERWREVLARRPPPPLAGSPRRQLAARDALAPARWLWVTPELPPADSPLRRALADARSDMPGARLTLAIARAPARPEVDLLLAQGIEVAAGVGDWPGWFRDRRFHYDAVLGGAPELDALVAETQPQAARRAAA